MEDIESLETRPPRDVDMVTFHHRPAGLANDPDWQAFIQANLALLHWPLVKPVFKCDPYFVDVGTTPGSLVDQSRYWFGLFSHQRNTFTWKGVLQVPLPISQDDVDAAAVVGP